MAIRNARPFRWSPTGLTDTLDATYNKQGAMTQLANLVPDLTTRNQWICRPAAFQLTNFTGFTTPGFVSALKVIGNLAVGMLATGRNAGKDEPFVYNLSTGAFITVSGVTSANVPTSPPTSGVWTAPTIDFVGTWAIITHPGFNGTNGYYGGINLSNPVSPAYQSGNLATNPLTSVPQWVAQFNGRAWFGLNPTSGQPSAAWSNSLDPWTATNANQALFFDDNEALVGAIGLPLTNVLGGIQQSLLVFKINNIYQITGDAATSDLKKNAIPVQSGCIAAGSICITPKGVAYLDDDGIRLVTQQGVVSDPLGYDGEGVVLPLVNAKILSRVVAAANGSVLRIAFQNSLASGNPNQEYWFDIVRGIWSGPHSFSSSLISVANGATFICAPVGVLGSLWQSDFYPGSTSTFIENGRQLTWTYQTAMLPDDGNMSEKWMLQCTLNLGAPPGTQMVNVICANQDGVSYDAATVTLTTMPAQWGSATWGQFVWGGASAALRPYKVSWDQPIVFRRISVTATSNSGAGMRVGELFMQIAELGYIQQES